MLNKMALRLDGTQDFQKKLAPIVLTTINARYIHSSFGLRYLQANLKELQGKSLIKEFTLEVRAEDILEQILAHQPKIVAFSVFIWNITQITHVVSLLKVVAPDITIVLGGPEVSYEQTHQAVVQQADFVISGWGEVSFLELCRVLLVNTDDSLLEKFIAGKQAKLAELHLPYDLYSDEDIKNRIVYVEASRGCPFKCEFCLSALDKTAWPFDIDVFLQEMQKLYQRGVRHFKFVDRTFNLKVANSTKILQFFLQRLDDDLFLHFEVIPDHLPPAIKELIAQFPPHTLQFEIGIQTFNEEVQARIGRKQNNQKAKENLTWIRENTNAHIHADLIFGLPGESLESFAESFNALYQLRPHEIQMGILKRLKGSPIIRHSDAFDMKYSTHPPYAIVANSLIDYHDVQRAGRMARYWDLIANSGHFKNSLEILFKGGAFQNLNKISEYIFAQAQRTHKISLLNLYDFVYQAGVSCLDVNQSSLFASLEQDYVDSGLKSKPRFLQMTAQPRIKENKKNNKHRLRQSRH